MIETFYGVSFLGIGILIDQLGTYMMLSTLGIFAAAVCSSSDGTSVSVAGVMGRR
jgi:malate permease and related proteins